MATFTRYDKARETRANPFRRKRRANGAARYLTPLQAAQNASLYDRAGNRK